MKSAAVTITFLVILVLSVALIASRQAKAEIVATKLTVSCSQNIVTILMPQPAISVSLSFADILRLCTIPA